MPVSHSPADGPRARRYMQGRTAAGPGRKPALARAATILALMTALSGGLAAVAQAGSSSNARAATGSERRAIINALIAQDGSANGVAGVYVSRSNGNLAVVCERTPERQLESYVFVHSAGRWRLSTYGPARHAGSAADRRLEIACH